LSSTQLNASTSVAGTFTYSPAAGSMLHAGAGQTLALIFTPTNAVNYDVVNISRSISVVPASLIITAVDKTMAVGGSVPMLTAVGNALVSPDTIATLDTAPTLATPATSSSPTGTYPITVSGAVDADYDISFVDGTLTVVSASGIGGGEGGSQSSNGKCGMGGGIVALILALMMVMHGKLRE
jgi:hypothetical protein